MQTITIPNVLRITPMLTAGMIGPNTPSEAKAMIVTILIAIRYKLGLEDQRVFSYRKGTGGLFPL